MIERVSSFSAGWVSIMCLTSVCIAASRGVELQTISQVKARCGQNVTLTCEANSSHKMDIKLFAWQIRNKIMCQYKDGRLDFEGLCENTPHHTLNLTLFNVMPVDQGDFHCKLRSTVGVKNAKTIVTVQDCFGSHSSSINKSHAVCSYNGVYPSGTVHWFLKEANLTDSASTQREEDQHGLYNVWSTLDHRGNLSEPYSCSLWIPSVGKYLPSQQILIIKKQKSSGSTVKLQWIALMVEVMVVMCMT